jgi:hypothetical protein
MRAGYGFTSLRVHTLSPLVAKRVDEMIAFNTVLAHDWRDLLQKLAREFGERELLLAAIINGLDMEVSARQGIETRLNALRVKARGLREDLDAMGVFLTRAEAAYTDADSQIAALARNLTEEWRESERRLAPTLNYAKIGLNFEDAEKIEAIRSLDGLFMNSKRNTAYFKPLNVKFEVLPEDID